MKLHFRMCLTEKSQPTEKKAEKCREFEENTESQEVSQNLTN